MPLHMRPRVEPPSDIYIQAIPAYWRKAGDKPKDGEPYNYLFARLKNGNWAVLDNQTGERVPGTYLSMNLEAAKQRLREAIKEQSK